jgi:hypothetical protein
MANKHIVCINILLIILILLITIGGICWYVSYTIREKYLQDDPKLIELKQILTPLDPCVKDIKFYKGGKSYTINKEKIYLCLKDENGNYYPNNTLIYVTIHEISHLLNKDDVGHTEKFNAIFDKLLQKAESIGVFNPNIPIEQNYCAHGTEE